MKREKGADDITEIIMDESFPKLMTNNKAEVREALRRPGRVDIKMYN